MANTRPVVTSVSLRDGQVTRAISARTSRTNFAGSTATPLFSTPDCQDYSAPQRRWQGWRVSNPQPPVLETGALAN